MPRGAPDYSNVRAYGPMQRLDDMAELAARLGSPDRFERGGRIVYLESFEYGLSSWNPTTYGTGAEAILVPTIKNTGRFSARLTGGSDGAGAVKIFRKFAYPVLNKYSAEFAVHFEAHTGDIRLRLVQHDGTTEYQYNVKYDPINDVLYYQDSAGDWQTIAEDLDLQSPYMGFHIFKLVADFENQVYERLVVDNETYDLSSYDAYSFTSGDCPNVRVDVLLYSETGYNGFSYVDDIILKQNEP
jgi:hypothetical protein